MDTIIIYIAIGFGVMIASLADLRDSEHHAVVMARLKGEPVPVTSDLSIKAMLFDDPKIVFALVCLVLIWPAWCWRK